VREKRVVQRRRKQKGSFAGDFEELVAQFPVPETQPPSSATSTVRSPELQEKISIHAALFERAVGG
jgi:hypothetical protein